MDRHECVFAMCAAFDERWELPMKDPAFPSDPGMTQAERDELLIKMEKVFDDVITVHTAGAVANREALIPLKQAFSEKLLKEAAMTVAAQHSLHGGIVLPEGYIPWHNATEEGPAGWHEETIVETFWRTGSTGGPETSCISDYPWHREGSDDEEYIMGWRPLKHENDGWVERVDTDGTMPDGISPTEQVLVRLRSGTTGSRTANRWDWSQQGSTDDIVAFRLVERLNNPPTITEVVATPTLPSGFSPWHGKTTELEGVHPRTKVEVFDRDRDVDTAEAEDYNWQHENDGDDIVGFRYRERQYFVENMDDDDIKNWFGSNTRVTAPVKEGYVLRDPRMPDELRKQLPPGLTPDTKVNVLFCDGSYDENARQARFWAWGGLVEDASDACIAGFKIVE